MSTNFSAVTVVAGASFPNCNSGKGERISLLFDTAGNGVEPAAFDKLSTKYKAPDIPPCPDIEIPDASPNPGLILVSPNTALTTVSAVKPPASVTLIVKE